MTDPITATTSATPGAARVSRLFLLRAVTALIWAGLLVAAVSSTGSFTPQQAIPGFAVALLIVYPLIDVLASVIDARSARSGANGSVGTQLFNAAIGLTATAAIAVAASHGADAILRVFGSWALLTGLIQLGLAVARRRHSTVGQVPMILSGSISTLVGIGFIVMAGKSELNLSNLAGYATAGAVFFLISAWRLRSRSATAERATETRVDV